MSMSTIVRSEPASRQFDAGCPAGAERALRTRFTELFEDRAPHRPGWDAMGRARADWLRPWPTPAGLVSSPP